MVGCYVVVSNFTLSTGLDQLAMVSLLADTLKEIQEGMETLRKDVNRLKASSSAPPSREPTTTTSRNNEQEPPQRIPGISWAEEMDILDPIINEQAGDEARVGEVSPCTKACIMASFYSMAKNARRSLWRKFIITKAPITCTPRLKSMRIRAQRALSKQTGPWLVYQH